MQPFCTTLGTEGQRSDGCHTPLCAAGAGPYGNTGTAQVPIPTAPKALVPSRYLLSMRCLNLIPLNPVTFLKYLARYSDTI